MKFFKASTILLALGGILAGFVNGLLGAGGGIIIVFVLSKLIKEGDSRDIFANALCVMLPLSIVSCTVYVLNGSTSFGGFSIFIIPAILGGLLGGFLLCKINTFFLKKLFAALVAISGVLLFFR
ncbi:MAG: TSUP family transporter [Clostridia bacterium]|nr:TSUP family transporter [Clostridia bacterium]